MENQEDNIEMENSQQNQEMDTNVETADNQIQPEPQENTGEELADQIETDVTEKNRKPKLASFQEEGMDFVDDDEDEPWPGNVTSDAVIEQPVVIKQAVREQSLKPDGALNQHSVLHTHIEEDEDEGQGQENEAKSVLSLQKQPDEHDLGIYDDNAVCDDLSDTEMGDGPATQRDNISESGLAEPPEINISEEAHEETEEQLTVAVSEPPEGFELDNLEQPPDGLDAPHVSWVPYKKHLTARNAQNSDGSYGLRGKANTPASLMTDYLGSQFSIDPAGDTPRNASRIASESREAMFRRAMTLLSARCTSVVPGVETPYGSTSRGQGSIGGQVPQYFYIRQQKPKPNMPPVKAWNGYNGNIYFEPIHITPVNSSGNLDETESRQFQGLVSRKTNRPDSNNTHTRTFSRATNKSSIKSGKTISSRPFVMYDKRSVINRFNKNIQQELEWLESQESTGSLAVRPKSDPVKSQPREQTVYNKEKICKGSMAHKLSMANKQNSPMLKVNGDKFSSPTTMSPLLRTQTQYTLSNRLTTNSPDLFHPLPPLEQLRATVRHMDNVSNPAVKASNYRQSRPVTDEFKPYIKYSPEIKPKRQTSLV